LVGTLNAGSFERTQGSAEHSGSPSTCKRRKRLGIEVPSGLLSIADEVIE
jgi:hypothetical protein